MWIFTKLCQIYAINIRNWRNGVIPKISVRQKIAEITDTPVENLLTNEEKSVVNEILKKNSR